MVRKGYLLPLSFLGFNRWLSSAASEAVPHWTGTMLAGAQETMHFQQTRTGSPLGWQLAHSRRLVNVDELQNTVGKLEIFPCIKNTKENGSKH